MPRGHANHLAQALQQPLLLPRDMDSIQRIRQPNLFMSLKRDLAMVSCSLPTQIFKISLSCFIVLLAFLIMHNIFMQVTQQVYVTKDWVRNANNKFEAEAQTRRDVEKVLAIANYKKTQLAEKLKAAENARQNVEVGLKNAKAQAEDQRKQLYTTQLNLATEQAVVLDLKDKLQRAEEALKVAQEAAKAVETAAYEREGLETKARLTAEVAGVCRDYCVETYKQALDQARVPADSDLRRADQVYYPKDIREDTTGPSPPAAFPLPPPKKSLHTKKPPQGAEIPAGAQKEKKGEVMAFRTEEKAKEKGKEKAKNKADANPFEDTLIIGDMVSKAKAIESKSKIDSKKDSHQSQL